MGVLRGTPEDLMLVRHTLLHLFLNDYTHTHRYRTIRHKINA